MRIEGEPITNNGHQRIDGGVLTPCMEWVSDKGDDLLDQIEITLLTVARDLQRLPTDIKEALQRGQIVLTALMMGKPEDGLRRLIPSEVAEMVIFKLDELPQGTEVPYVIYRGMYPWGARHQCDIEGSRGNCSALSFLEAFQKAEPEKVGFAKALKHAAKNGISSQCPKNRRGQILAIADALERITQLPLVGVIWRSSPPSLIGVGAVLSVASKGCRDEAGEWVQAVKDGLPTPQYTGPTPMPSGGESGFVGTDVLLVLGIIVFGSCIGITAGMANKRD